MCDFDGNQAILSADNAVRALTSISPLELMGQGKLFADQRGRTYCPQELGKLTIPLLSAIRMNILLADKAMQTKNSNGHWIPTASAEGFYEWVDTGKRHSTGTPVKQLRWFVDILDAVGLRYRCNEIE
ncbi:hypothetical protein [Chromatium okenii]|uniref:hypothetical protein n=1 Tax=Chromatium okenii TaxID=61644 RepID=UPI0026F0764B|nr:hypothetical protein [Chromatium okenii]MBV5308557.1 hypothetical protein [Chromatium okenii]